MATPDPRSPIAIVGMAALFPGSIDRHGFWRDIQAGRDLVGDVPPTHWLIEDYYDPDPAARDKTYSKRGAFLTPVDFDPVAWGMPPSNLPATDTIQLLSLMVAQQVLEDACGSRFATMSRERVSVILGATSAQGLFGSMVSRLQRPVWTKALREQGLSESAVAEACERIASHYVDWQESTFPGLLGNVVAGRIANRLDLGGTNCVTDAACASSLAALEMAVAELRLGHSDLVISGGADTMNDIFMYVCFSKTPALSPTGDCRPFSEEADGTLLGEGIGMVALKRLADAERDDDRIYAVIRGVGASSDGRSKSVYAPVPAGQARALRRAYEQAGYGPDTVELMEAHGTGTRAGDAAELAALREVFEETGRPDRGWCALGSIKSQVGHTKAAAGAAGLFKAAMALTHGVLPPTIKVSRPDPKLRIEDSPFYLNTVARPWLRDDRHPRRASVSSFGFGGSNYHLTLEEYTGPGRRALRTRPAGGEMVLLSADSTDALADLCRELAPDAGRPGMLAFLARATQRSFDPAAPARLGIFAGSEAELEGKLARAAELAQAGRDLSVPGGIELTTAPPTPEVAFLFPGQGSQYPFMGAEVCMGWEAARAVWDATLPLELAPGEPRLHEVVFPRPAFDETESARQRARLTETQWAQPAIGATSLMLLRLLREAGVRPAAVAGHSFGELTALCAAEVLSPGDLLRVARRRGELMAEVAAVPGAMTSVAGVAVPELHARLAEWGSKVVVANYNSPGQVVLSGGVEEIAEVERRLAEIGGATTRLPVATAFHSAIVEPARDPFRAFLEGIEVTAPTVEVYGNASAAPYPAPPGAIRDVLAEQIVQPVRFVDQIEAMYSRGIRVFVEVGPGNVLTSLVGHILRDRPHRAVALDRRGRPGVGTLNEGLGRLSLAGVPVDHERLWSEFIPVPDPRETRRPSMVVKIGSTGYAKPYPPAPGAAPLPKPSATPPSAEGPRVAASPPAAPPAESVRPPAPPAASANGSSPSPPAASAATAVPWGYPAAAPGVQLAWVQAFQEAQRQTAESHAAFTRAMAETHAAFLRSTEASLHALAALATGTAPPPMAGLPSATPSLPAPLPAAPAFASMPPPPPAPPAFASMPPPPAAAPPEPPRPPAAARASTLSTAELESLMLRVVAQSTGYPEEMLGLDMDLEADLGVDSIKRVEILSATVDQAPGLPNVGFAQLGGKRTLREIIDVFATEMAGTGSREGGHTAETPTQPRRDRPPGTGEDPSAPAAATPLTRAAARAVEAPAPGLALPGLLGPAPVVLIDDGARVADALAAALAARGVDAVVREEVAPDAGTVIWLGGLRRVRGVEDAAAVHRDALRVARAAAPRLAEHGGAFVTVQDTGGDFGLSGADRAWAGGIAALGRTAALEWPRAHLRMLDVARGDRPAQAVAEAIRDELLAGGADREVGLRADGRRFVLETHPAPLEGAGRGGSPLTPGSVVLASGGARGITAACLVGLARAARCRFLLLGRTPLGEEPEACRGVEADADLKRALLLDARRRGEEPSPADLRRAAERIRSAREVRGTLEAIRAAGGEARYHAVDATDPRAVAEAVAAARAEWGPVTGVVHGAGVLADRRIAEKTDDQYDRVFDTKVRGLHALLEATREDDLSFLLLFSSVAARFGNPGQADYAMANEVLNTVAALEQRRRGPRCTVRSLGWGPWEGGMVDEGLRRHFAARGTALIPVADGVRAFLDELSAGPGSPPAVVLAAGNSVGVAPAAAPVAYDLLLDPAGYPFLDDHRVRGEVVAPVALAMEWFARAARARWPGLESLTLREVRVLRGIRLGSFERRERLVLRATELSGPGAPALSLELLGADGRRHYTAVAEPGTPSGRGGDPAPPAALEPWPGQVYGPDGLFHGPAFHLLRGVEVSPRGLVASVGGVVDRGWPGRWLLDPALLDGGLQAALLWAERVLGEASLPTSIEAVHVAAAGPVHGPTRCVLSAREAGADHVVVDLVFRDAGGARVAGMRGVTAHRLPGGWSAPGQPLVEEPLGDGR